MKKLLSISVATIMGLGMLLCGCTEGEESIDYLNEYDDGSKLNSVTAQTEGELYSLEEAYEIGFLSQRDLKKIAYFHNADNEATFPVGLSEAAEGAIKNTYAEKYRNDEHFNSEEITAEVFSVRSFYGYYYKSCIVTVDSTLWNYTTDVVDEWKEIGGVNFHFTDHGGLSVWMPKSYIYFLEDAYEYGWVAKEDLTNIAYYYHTLNFGSGFYEWYADLEEYVDFTPKPLMPEVLNAETELKVRQAELMYDQTTFAPMFANSTVEDVQIVKYYGTYGKCVMFAATVKNRDEGMVESDEKQISTYNSPPMYDINLGGITIRNYCPNWIYVWFDK